jgi:hypothetical protein
VSGRQAVREGAILLDKHTPNWYRVIDKKTLDLASCENCVCGQVGRAAYDGLIKVPGYRKDRRWLGYTGFLKVLKRLTGMYFAGSRFGFDAYDASYTTLDRYWKEEINLRLKRDAEAA